MPPDDKIPGCELMILVCIRYLKRARVRNSRHNSERSESLKMMFKNSDSYTGHQGFWFMYT